MFPTITLPGPKLITFRLLCGIVELCKRSIQEQLCALLSQFAVVVKCSPGTSFELVKSNNTFCWNIVLRDCVTPTAWHSHASQLTLSQCALRGKRPYDAGDMHLYRYLYHTYLLLLLIIIDFCERDDQPTMQTFHGCCSYSNQFRSSQLHQIKSTIALLKLNISMYINP